MSSRLNPRDYDLGELRDAVRETSRRRDDGRRDTRRERGRRDARRERGRRDEPAYGGVPGSDASSNGGAGDGPDRTRAPDGRYENPRSRESHSGERPSDGDRAGTGRPDRQTAAVSAPDERPSVGRMRRNARRFARSSSRDRTADGAPRRRNWSGSDGESRRRNAARSGRIGTAPRPTGAAGGFELLSKGSRGDVERPYLTRLPDGYDAQVEILAWLEGLLETCGREATLEALAYYEAVGWLSGDSHESLGDFVEGLTAVEPPDPRSLDVDDHRESLRYVARLAGRVDD